MWQRILGVSGAAMLAMAALAGPADAAARCRNTGNFDAWLAAFKQEAAAKGISRQAISAALDGVTFDLPSSGATVGRACFSRASCSSPAA